MRKIIEWFTPRRRQYIYRLTTAGLALAGGYGLLDGAEVERWATFLGVALVTGMADANTRPDGDGTDAGTDG